MRGTRPTNRRMDRSRVVVRRATHADCDAIKAINRNIYNGLDHFLSTFHYEVAMESSFPFVGKIDGKVVGYAHGKVLRDGCAIGLAHARVDEQYQGRGIYNKVLMGLLTEAVKRFPNLAEIFWTTDAREDVQKLMKKNANIKLVDEGPTISIEETISNLKALCKSQRFKDLSAKYNIDKVTEVPSREALRLLTEQLQYEHFAGDTFTIRYQPRDWSRSTLGEQLTTSRLHVSRCGRTGRVEAYSFSTQIALEVGLRYWVEFYSPRDGSQAHLAVPHYLYHLRQVAETSTGDHGLVSVLCTLPGHDDQEELRGVVGEQLGLASHRLSQLPMLLLGCKLSDVFPQSSKL